MTLTIAKNLSRSDGCDAGLADTGGTGEVFSAEELLRFQRLNKAPSLLTRQRSSSLQATWEQGKYELKHHIYHTHFHWNHYHFQKIL